MPLSVDSDGFEVLRRSEKDGSNFGSEAGLRLLSARLRELAVLFFLMGWLTSLGVGRLPATGTPTTQDLHSTKRLRPSPAMISSLMFRSEILSSTRWMSILS